MARLAMSRRWCPAVRCPQLITQLLGQLTLHGDGDGLRSSRVCADNQQKGGFKTSERQRAVMAFFQMERAPNAVQC